MVIASEEAGRLDCAVVRLEVLLDGLVAVVAVDVDPVLVL
jgi:hypothetical protein